MHPTQKIILYADDDEDDRKLLADIVKQMHPEWEVVMAKDGHDAMGKLSLLQALGDVPGLIILDMNMPMLDGRQTLELIRRNSYWEDVPVCIFSTSSRARFADIAMQFEVDLVTKPLSHEELVESIRNMLLLCK